MAGLFFGYSHKMYGILFYSVYQGSEHIRSGDLSNPVSDLEEALLFHFLGHTRFDILYDSKNRMVVAVWPTQG